MPKNKQIDKRLKNLFEDVKPEHTSTEAKPVSSNRVDSNPPVQQPVASNTSEFARQPVEMASVVTHKESVMTLAFQAGQNSWATLQVLDDTEQR